MSKRNEGCLQITKYSIKHHAWIFKYNYFIARIMKSLTPYVVLKGWQTLWRDKNFIKLGFKFLVFKFSGFPPLQILNREFKKRNSKFIIRFWFYLKMKNETQQLTTNFMWKYIFTLNF